MCHLWQFPEELSLSKEKRRLSDTELNPRFGAGGRGEKVWIDAEILFRESQERYLFEVIVIGETERASADDTRTGGGKVRFADRADGKTGGSNGAVKSAESDALGAENE